MSSKINVVRISIANVQDYIFRVSIYGHMGVNYVRINYLTKIFVILDLFIIPILKSFMLQLTSQMPHGVVVVISINP